MSLRRSHTFSISDADILDVLYQYNPWWQNKEVITEEIHRSDFFKIKERLNDDTILALIGPRRAGKTILLHQLIKEVLDHTDRLNILFMSVDHPAVQLTGSLDRIFKIYQGNILKNSFSNLNEKVYIFLDEIQSFNGWELELKAYYDLKYKIKFLVTGSSSANIVEGASESLVGRIHSQIMLSVKFRDFLKFRIRDLSNIAERLRFSSKQMRNALHDALTTGKPELFYQQVELEQNNLIPFRDRILGELNNYLLYGGYPRVILETDKKKKAEYLEEYVSLTLHKDVQRLFKLEKTNALFNLFYLLCRTTPHRINKQELCSVLGIDKNTLNVYLNALESTFLSSEGIYYSTSTYHSIARERKIYILDIGMRNLYFNALNEQLLNQNMGEIVEIVTATHTTRLLFNLEGIKNKKLHYWIDDKQGIEVDLVINPFSITLPIEVKYQNDISNSDLRGLIRFNKKFAPNTSLLITKKDLGIQGSIILIPAWLYLIMC